MNLITLLSLSIFLATEVTVAFGASEVTLKELPNFYLEPSDYKVDPYTRAAASLQSLGKDKACAKLLALAKTRSEKRDEDPKWYEDLKVVILCRMLFSAKAGGEFRGPMIGGPSFLGNTD